MIISVPAVHAIVVRATAAAVPYHPARSPAQNTLPTITGTTSAKTLSWRTIVPMFPGSRSSWTRPASGVRQSSPRAATSSSAPPWSGTAVEPPTSSTPSTPYR